MLFDSHEQQYNVKRLRGKALPNTTDERVEGDDRSVANSKRFHVRHDFQLGLTSVEDNSRKQ